MDGLRIEGLDAAIDADALADGRVAARIDHVRISVSAAALIRLTRDFRFQAAVERLESDKVCLKVRKGSIKAGAEAALSIDSAGRVVAEVGAVSLGGIKLPGGLMGLFSGMLSDKLPPGVTLDCNRITVDHREMAASRGIGIAPVRSIRVTPQEIVLEL